MRLWADDASDYGNDRSWAALRDAAFSPSGAGGDCEPVDRLFRRSGLMREKWDRRTGDSVYGSLAVKVAITSMPTCPQW